MERRISREERKQRAGRFPVGSAAFSHASDARIILQLNEFAWSKIEPLYLKRRSLKIVTAQFLILSFIAPSISRWTPTRLNQCWITFSENGCYSKIRWFVRNTCASRITYKASQRECIDTMRPTCGLNESFALTFDHRNRADQCNLFSTRRTRAREGIRTLTAKDISYDYLVQLIRNA